ncbi:MAG: nucleoside triphosphate pyrophosphatase [Thermoanaerobacteraceae bacterium]
MNFILASGSPRRKELLDSLGLSFKIVKSDINEQSKEFEPSKYVMDIAYKKTYSVANSIKEESIVLGADTIVVIDNEILGKPQDEKRAFLMLKKLSGKMHKVYTGLSIVRTPDLKYVNDFSETKVWIKKLDNEEILRYIKTGECLDKAGAYAIQGFGALIVEKIEGDYFNVVGFPLSKLSSLLKDNFNINLL